MHGGNRTRLTAPPAVVLLCSPNTVVKAIGVMAAIPGKGRLRLSDLDTPRKKSMLSLFGIKVCAAPAPAPTPGRNTGRESGCLCGTTMPRTHAPRVSPRWVRRPRSRDRQNSPLLTPLSCAVPQAAPTPAAQCPHCEGWETEGETDDDDDDDDDDNNSGDDTDVEEDTGSAGVGLGASAGTGGLAFASPVAAGGSSHVARTLATPATQFDEIRARLR